MSLCIVVFAPWSWIMRCAAPSASPSVISSTRLRASTREREPDRARRRECKGLSTQSWRKMPSPFHRGITHSFTVLPCERRAFTLLSHVHKYCETVKPVKHGWVHTGILGISELYSGETVKAIFIKVLHEMYVYTHIHTISPVSGN